MDQATQLWAWWLSLLSAFAPVFTRPGWVRFVQWVTGTVLCWEEHTLTQILTALGLESRWQCWCCPWCCSEARLSPDWCWCCPAPQQPPPERART